MSFLLHIANVEGSWRLKNTLLEWSLTEVSHFYICWTSALLIDVFLNVVIVVVKFRSVYKFALVDSVRQSYLFLFFCSDKGGFCHREVSSRAGTHREFKKFRGVTPSNPRTKKGREGRWGKRERRKKECAVHRLKRVRAAKPGFESARTLQRQRISPSVTFWC